MFYTFKEILQQQQQQKLDADQNNTFTTSRPDTRWNIKCDVELPYDKIFTTILTS